MEPFNLRQEREDGEFDEGGFFVFSKDKEEEEDAWVDSLEKTGPGNFSEKARANAAAAAEFWDEGKVESEISQNNWRQILLEILNPKETARMAMNRLTGAEKKIPGKKKFPGPKMSPENAEKFRSLAEACDALVAQGVPEIFDIRKEDLVFPGFHFQVFRKNESPNANEPDSLLRRSEFSPAGVHGHPAASAEPATPSQPIQRAKRTEPRALPYQRASSRFCSGLPRILRVDCNFFRPPFSSRPPENFRHCPPRNIRYWHCPKSPLR